MEAVLGLGGLFFRAKDPDALNRWYNEHLGVAVGDDWWQTQAGPTVFAPFKADTDYFGRREQQWMVNFRVADLDALMAQLRNAGIAVETKPEWNSDIGRFARIHDPEGNPIELWEPGPNYEQC